MFRIIKYPQPHAGKVYLYVKYPFELKYQFPINEIKQVGIKLEKNLMHSLIISEGFMMPMKIYENIIQQRKEKKVLIP